MALELTKPAKGTPDWDVVLNGNFQEIMDYTSDIDAQMDNKANKDKTLQTNLYSEFASNVRNPNDGVTISNIFANPPLDKMAKFSSHYVNVTAEDGAPNVRKLWNVLTINAEPTRAVQIAIQTDRCVTGGESLDKSYGENAAIFIRTRHIDDANYTKWQGWKQLATVDTELTWYDVVFQNGYSYPNESKLKYAKDSCGNVFLQGCFLKATAILANDQVCVLPVGFRPLVATFLSFTANAGASGTSFSAAGYVNASGILSFTSKVPTNYELSMPICTNVIFKAAK